jgi:hypothetical protein
MSIIGRFHPGAAENRPRPALIRGTMAAAVHAINQRKWARAMRTLHIGQSARRRIDQKGSNPGRFAGRDRPWSSNHVDRRPA